MTQVKGRRGLVSTIRQVIACFHCGLPVPAGGSHRAAVLGTEREFCCTGCEAVARTIASAGFERYYETRTALALPPKSEVRPLSAVGNEASLILEHVRCAACLWLIEQVLRRQPGVTHASVNYATQRAQVRWDTEKTSLAAIIDSIRSVGYDACPYDPRTQDEVEHRERRTALWRLFVAGFGAMQVMMYAFPAYVDEVGPEAAQIMRWASLLITLPVLAFSCVPFFSGAARELAQRRIGLDTPIALGLGLGFAASAWATVTGSGDVYFDSISMLAFLLLGARYFEAAARRRAARALDPLLEWGNAQTYSPNQVVAIAPGERIPADGVVLEGSSSADESLLTGESRPVAKRAGDELIGGSVNLEQPLVMRVTRAGADTRAAAIARLAERGAASKPRSVETAERVARQLTWVIVLAAVAAGLYSANPWVSVAVLVVACPCALALAAPIVLTRASGALLGRGVLLTRASALEALDRVTDIVLDKTGTLTAGRVSLAKVLPLGRLDAEACLELAGALEASSRHPVARAFAGESSVQVQAPRNFPGRGIEGWVTGRRVRIGTAAFCNDIHSASFASVPWSRVYLANESGWLAAFELADSLRAEVPEFISDIKARSLTVHLASGDQPEVVGALARELGIERCTGAMTPEDKYRYLEHLQRESGVVAMVGDGLNDAPVLARADVSFAMGNGADAAQLKADVVVMSNSLEGVSRTCEVARRAMRLVRQNIAWAIAYNAIALPLAAAGFIGPWEAALAMGASSLTVLLNALRPLGAEPQWKASTSSFPSRSPSYS
ncbi:MAG TPA: heavy metal translocating P-type ATPase [Burkholderiales bacterium]|nr:heavy metal translocating P-type ATPase [Burkholderiales bacterium]